jgi:hypothetical protein
VKARKALAIRKKGPAALLATRDEQTKLNRSARLTGGRPTLQLPYPLWHITLIVAFWRACLRCSQARPTP